MKRLIEFCVNNTVFEDVVPVSAFVDLYTLYTPPFTLVPDL